MPTGWLLAFGAVVVAACSGPAGGDAAPPGLCTHVDPACTPSITPSYDTIYDAVLAPRCALLGGGCHGVEAIDTTLILNEREEAYRQLLGQTDGRSRVVPGAADCSVLMVRLASPATAFRMPPDDPLEPSLICAVFQWIENGALR